MVTTSTSTSPTATRAPAAEQTAAPVREAPSFQPAVDVCDCGAEVTIVADVPGARADGIDVSFDDGVLTVHAAVTPRSLPGRPIAREYGVGDYRRAFRLGDGFDASQITAECRAGVLTVRVPRLAAVRPRKIEVRG